jgi:hypothetical protein
MRHTDRAKAAISAGLRNSTRFMQVMASRRGKKRSKEHAASVAASQRIFFQMVKELQATGLSFKEAKAAVREKRGPRPSRKKD